MIEHGSSIRIAYEAEGLVLCAEKICCSASRNVWIMILWKADGILVIQVFRPCKSMAATLSEQLLLLTKDVINLFIFGSKHAQSRTDQHTAWRIFSLLFDKAFRDHYVCLGDFTTRHLQVINVLALSHTSETDFLIVYLRSSRKPNSKEAGHKSFRKTGICHTCGRSCITKR
jgi:hypothetical protein